MVLSDHQPDTPFGCVVTWGPRLAETGQFADWRIHICSHEGYADHEGHVCKCGDRYVEEASEGTAVVVAAAAEDPDHEADECMCLCHNVTVPGVVYCPECGRGAIA